MEQFTDQMNRTIRLENPPARILSVVPSQTELLYALGLEDRVVGITKFCIHPETWFRSKTRVGGTKKLDLSKIRALNPDLIIANKEENDRLQIEQLMTEFPVWMSDIQTLDDALEMIACVGSLTQKRDEAEAISHNIQTAFARLSLSQIQRSVAYFIWKSPYMAAGAGTFINEMLVKCGLKNIFEHSRYPEISAEEIRKAAPALILLSSEPFPFREKHIQEFKTLCPFSDIRVVDGEMFSWYGSRLQQSPAYFKQLFCTS